MPIDFTLSAEQNTLQAGVRQFAKEHLSGAYASYSHLSPGKERFQATRPIYEKAVAAGMIAGQIPPPLGGKAGSLIDAALIGEEFYAVESSASLTILGTGLGLAALILHGSPEQHKKYLKPFLDSSSLAPLASLVSSEFGGSANAFGDDGGAGIQTVAVLEGDEWVISGEKAWATNCAGWDYGGADLQCVVCRTEKTGPPSASGAIILVTRQDINRNPKGAYEVIEDIETIGHTAVCGPRIRFNELRVHNSNILGKPGDGPRMLATTFTTSAALVCAASVGIMRATFDAALNFSKSDRRGGRDPIINHQSVADLLIDIKMRMETSRYLCWKALHNIETRGDGELAYMAKIYGSECAVQSVYDAMRVVGVTSYSVKMPFGRLMEDALCMPIFDGGNVGVRRRQLQKLMTEAGYDPQSAAFGKS
jgi:alkylation response protein AidB-like acyl-CoA dehydrogenase